MTSRRLLLRSSALALGAPMINRGRFSLFARSNSEYSARAVDLVHRSTVIDMLGLLTLDYRKMSTWQSQPSRFQPTDYKRLIEAGITVFHPAVGYVSGDIYQESWRDISGWNSVLKGHPKEFLRIDHSGDFAQAKVLGKIGILLGQQNSEHFRTVDDVDRFYALGQRVSQLTYNTNRIGGGSPDPRNPGLTPYGVKVVERMNRLGMAIDVSHCGVKTTWDAIELSRKPVLVTHSNCRALVPGSLRCKSDDTIRRMAAKSGVIGITMVRGFVRASGSVTIEDVLNHIDHVVKLVGVEHVGIGSDVDLDGRDASAVRRWDLDGIDYATKIYDLAEGLVRRKYSDPDIQLILGANFERALSQIWAS